MQSTDDRSTNMRGRISHVSSSHSRPDIRVFYKECVSVARLGYDVTLIAPESVDPYPDLGVQVIPVRRYANRFLRMAFGALKVGRQVMRIDQDIVHLHNPEMIPVGLMLKLRGSRVVYDAHEDLPDQIAVKEWIPTPLRGVAIQGGKLAIGLADRFFDGIVAATPTIAEDYTPAKTIVLRNLPMVSEVQDAPTDVDRSNAPFIYVGGVTRVRGMVQLVEAMAIAGPATGRVLEIYGPIDTAKFEAELKEMEGWKWVRYCGIVPASEIPTVLSRSSVGVVTILDAPNHRRSEPNKLFEYMLAELPVVASNFEYWHQFVSDPNTGLQVDPADPRDIANALIHLANNPEEAAAMGRRGRALVLAGYTWEQQLSQLDDMYMRIMDKQHS